MLGSYTMVKITKEEFEILKPRCHCLDNEEILWNDRYKYRGIPEYIHNHRKKIKSVVTKEKFEKIQPRCNCPCNQMLEWKEYYKRYGIPKYKIGHRDQSIRTKKAVERHKLIREEFDRIKPRCNCPCNQEIPWSNRFLYRKFAKYLTGHNVIGRKQTEEAIIKMSNSLKGRIVWNKGKKMSEEYCIKMSLCNLGRKTSEETKKKQSEAHKGEKSYLWKGGKSFEPYCKEFNNQTKRKVRNSHNNNCFLCNLTEKDNITKTGKIMKLCVHHIDGDKQQGCNGKNWYLVPLCMKCHGKTIRSPETYVKLIQLLLNLYSIKDVWIWFM